MEVEGECITNKLLTDIEKLKNDKIVLAQRSEVEEEFITNSLQRKLSEVTEEKEKLRQKINSSTPCTSPVKVCPEVQANPESPFLPHPQTVLYFYFGVSLRFIFIVDALGIKYQSVNSCR